MTRDRVWTNVTSVTVELQSECQSTWCPGGCWSFGFVFHVLCNVFKVLLEIKWFSKAFAWWIQSLGGFSHLLKVVATARCFWSCGSWGGTCSPLGLLGSVSPVCEGAEERPVEGNSQLGRGGMSLPELEFLNPPAGSGARCVHASPARLLRTFPGTRGCSGQGASAPWARLCHGALSSLSPTKSKNKVTGGQTCPFRAALARALLQVPPAGA